MKKHNLIVNTLNFVAKLWLLLCIIYCLQLIFFLTTDKGGYFFRTKNSVWGISNTYRDGYPIPAKLSVQMPPDTIVQWKHQNNSGEIHLRKSTLFRSDMADSILNDTAIKKQYYFSKWLVEYGTQEGNDSTSSFVAEDEFALFHSIVKNKRSNFSASVKNSYFMDVDVCVKSKNKIQNFALALYSLISALVMLLISFNVYKLFGYIKKGDNFLSPLYKKVFNIGLIVICSELIKIGLSLLYSRWYGAIRLEKVSSIPKLGGQEFTVQFNPGADFTFSHFLLGLSLIVLASLFKYGRQLEKENALTI